MCAEAFSGEPRLRPCSEGDRAAIESVLRLSFTDAPGLADLWFWKHFTRSGRQPEEIIVAEIDGRVVACFHFTVLPLQLGHGSQVLASWDSDFGVLPEARGAGLTARAYAQSDSWLVGGGVPIRGGFAGTALNAKVHGNVVVPSSAVTFRKVIGLAALRTRLHGIGNRALSLPGVKRALGARDRVIDIQIEGLPECHLRLTAHGFFLDPGLAGSKMGVKVPHALVLALNKGTRALAHALVVGMTKGRLRIRGVSHWTALAMSLVAGLLRLR